MTITSDRKQLRELSRGLLQSYSAGHLRISFNNYLKGVVWIFAVILLTKILNGRFPIDSISDLDTYCERESFWLSNKFPKLNKSYILLKESLPVRTVDSHLKLFSGLLSQVSDIDGILSWLYQYFKSDREKEAFNKSLKRHQKISGSDLLPTTQFFTEQYMINYIVRTALRHVNPETTDLENLRVIDPACGGANFLMYAFDYLLEQYRTKGKSSISDIVNCLLKNTLVGYDLDNTLSGVGKINLFIKACKYVEPDYLAEPRIFGGAPEDQLGFLRIDRERPSEVKIFDPEFDHEFNFSDIVGEIPHRVFITNPPFMGIRDMATDLKIYLQSNYSLSNGDLCVSFMFRCLEMLREEEKLGLVNQTSWMYLKTFKEFRRYVIENHFLEECVDLGNKSFIDIGGEKSNVALTILAKTRAHSKSRFYYLRSLPLAIKAKLLENNEITPDATVFQKEFLKNRNYEVHYILSDGFGQMLSELPKYGEYANPMQGTSTGDNSEFVDYAWKRLNDPDWRLVSKGGGYCKWKGLNIYKVKWGKDAEYIKLNNGSALRNLDKIDSTDLVYSDTGTLGMNVRVRIDNQVFIASGPGIQIITGEPFSHLAYLNSRVASFFIKMLSPKLTISAGYIAGLPVVEKLLFSKVLSDLAKRCVCLKDTILASKIRNEEFSHIDYKSIKDINNHVEQEILRDLKNELERLKAESEIEKYIESEFGFSEDQISIMRRIVGSCASSNQRNRIITPLNELDAQLAASLDVNCQYSTSFLGNTGLGCEGFLEISSLSFKTAPIEIYEIISKSIGNMRLIKQKYIEDLLHKLSLYVLGFQNNRTRENVSSGITEIASQINVIVQDLDEQIKASGIKLTLNDWLNCRLKKHHNASFRGAPILIFKESRGGSLRFIEVD